MVRTSRSNKTKTKDVQPAVAALISNARQEASRQQNHRNVAKPPFRHYKDLIREECAEFRVIKAKYYKHLRAAPKPAESVFHTNHPICQPSLGPPVEHGTRPLSRLPPHILNVLNDHYVALTKGHIVPEADLYNYGTSPCEVPMPSFVDEREYLRFIQEIEEEERQMELLAQCSTSADGPKVKPYNGQYLSHGEKVGIFQIVGSGPTTTAICLKTRDVFTAQVIPKWKVVRTMNVIRRLQVPATHASVSGYEMHMSEVCVSKRLELIHSDGRWIVFNPLSTNTIHSYALERLDEITEAEVMEIFRKIVELVEFCHSRKVLLTNFRPRNFYLSKAEDGSWIVRPAFIQDLGCEDDTADGVNSRRTVLAAFMAPEMLKVSNRPPHTRETDVWGLGVLLYILLVGKYPFYEKETVSLFRVIKFKQHKWPLNFISAKARGIVDRLLRKVPLTRINLPDLKAKLRGEFRDVRCRSNMILKQHDLITKMDLLEMYYNAYKGRLLPQNVEPIREELMLCRRESPKSGTFARKDVRLVFEGIKEKLNKSTTIYQRSVMRNRLHQINTVLQKQEEQKAKAENRPMKTVHVFMHQLSKEILLPSVIYPLSAHYHPSQNPMDWMVYKALRDADELAFPKMNRGTRVKTYSAPVYKGRDISICQ